MTPSRLPTVAGIIAAVAARHGLTPNDLLGTVTTSERRPPHLNRSAEVVACRRACIIALHEQRPDMSQPEIARACGLTTHSRVNEVIQAHRRAKARPNQQTPSVAGTAPAGALPAVAD